MPPILPCIVGPTACGKTRLAVLTAQQFNGEVVSVDSMQIYRGMTIGTAAPTPQEMEGIPHHMVAVADPAENWSAARFAAAADECIQDILSRNKLPVLAGGTGLYLDAIIAGRRFAPGSAGGAVRHALQRQLEEEGIGPLLAGLGPPPEARRPAFRPPAGRSAPACPPGPERPDRCTRGRTVGAAPGSPGRAGRWSARSPGRPPGPGGSACGPPGGAAGPPPGPPGPAPPAAAKRGIFRQLSKL